MTKEQFNQICAELEQRGYKRNFSKDEPIKGSGIHYYWKVLEWRQYPSGEEYDDTRAINQLLFKIYHLEEFAHRVEPESLYAFEPVVCFSRNTGERIDLILSHPKRSINELEEIATKFGKWADENIKEIEE